MSVYSIQITLQFILLLFCTCLTSVHADQADHLNMSVQATDGSRSVATVNIGVLAYRGEEHARQKWKSTLDYLDSVITDVRFNIQPLTLPQMRNAVAERSLAFILTNPGNYVELEADYGVSRLLTLAPQGDNAPKHTIGSAIIVRRERDDLQNIADLNDRSMMAVTEQAFGGFQVAWRELMKHNIDPFSDLARLEFAGFPQDDILYAVLQGKVDAGVVRACVLEGMQREGRIEAGQLRVLDPRKHENFNCQTSTQLYPNWPLAKLRHTSDALAKQVAMALLALANNSTVTTAGGYGGWTIPMDYLPVHELFRDLQIGPYSWMGQTNLQHLWARYWQWLVFFFLALLWVFWHMARVEHLVTVRTQQLSEANSILKDEIDIRQQAERRAHLRQIELAHVSRISAVGELASGMAHELNQPLSAINSYAQGMTWRLQAGEMKPDELIDIHQHITAQAERAGAIIQRFRGFLRKEELSCTNVDVNIAIREALELFSTEVRKWDITIRRELSPNLPPVCAEMIQIEQVILNLLRNSAEAMQVLDKGTRHILIRSIHKDDSVQIQICDSGPGLSGEAAGHLFDPFYTTKTDGLGLGLSISHSILESQGGRLELLKHDQHGVTLAMTWPVSGDEEPDEQ